MYSSFSTVNTEPSDAVFNSHLYLFPNPTKDMFYIQTTLEIPYEIRIINLNGQFVSDIEIIENGVVEFDSESLSSGIYSITILKDDILETKKITIIH